MDFQVPTFIQEIEEMPSRQAIDVKELERKRKTEREDRALIKLLAADCVYNKGMFDVMYCENTSEQRKSSVSYSYSKISIHKRVYSYANGGSSTN